MLCFKALSIRRIAWVGGVCMLLAGAQGYAAEPWDILNPGPPQRPRASAHALPEILNQLNREDCNAKVLGTAIGGLVGGVVGRAVDDEGMQGVLVGGAVGAAVGNIVARELEKNGTICSDRVRPYYDDRGPSARPYYDDRAPSARPHYDDRPPVDRLPPEPMSSDGTRF